MVIGNRVRIVRLDQPEIVSLSKQEQEEIRSMIGKIFEVVEIDEYGSAWVSNEWNRDDGKIESHSSALGPDEIELVDRNAS